MLSDLMAAAGLSVRDDRAICGHYSVDRWYEIVLELLRSDDPPTALFTAQNFVTIGGVQALHELGLHREIALVAESKPVKDDEEKKMLFNEINILRELVSIRL